MFRFTIRDWMWLTMLMGLLMMWASEQHWRSIDWAKAIKNQGRLYDEIDNQRAQMRKLGAKYIAECELRRQAEQRLAAAEAAARKSD
jgi:hypothetical protein